MKDFFELPIFIQLVAVSGYMGYAIAQRGYRENEKLADVLLAVMLFGLPVGCGIVWGAGGLGVTALFITGPLMGLCWASFGKNWFFNFLRYYGFSTKMSKGTAWDVVTGDKGVEYDRIKVVTKKGDTLICRSTYKFKDAPFAPFVASAEGIAFYVDKIKRNGDGSYKNLENTVFEGGFDVTYIPMSEIEKISFRTYKRGS